MSAPRQADLALGDRLVDGRVKELLRLVERALVRVRVRGRMPRRAVRIGHSSAFSLGGSSAGVGRCTGSRCTCSGGSGPRMGPVAVRFPRHPSKAFFPTAQRVVRWMKTVERLACHSFSAREARSSSALSKAGMALKAMATSKLEWLSDAAIPG